MTKLKELFSPQIFLPSLVGGGITALFEIILAISFAALIFSGSLAPFVAQGTGLALTGAIITGVVVAVLSTVPGIVAGNQDVPAAIVAIIAAAIVSNVSGPPEVAFVTVVTAVVISTTLTGLVFLGLGTFHMGRWVRFLPYPVIGGFLGGTGWLLLTGALGLMTDLSFDWAQLLLFFQGDILLHWLPGLIFAALLLLANRYVNHFLLMPGFILLGLAVFYGYVWVTGSSLAEVTAAGWLLGPFPEEQSLWQPLTRLDFSLVNWRVIGSQAGNMVTIFIVSTLSLLLNAGGLELITGEDIDLNRELRSAGTGNLLAGLFGGIIGYQQLSVSALNLKMGAASRLSGLIAAAFCLLMMFQGASLLGLVPKVIVGGLLLYLALSFLLEWVIESWFRLPLADAFIILLIVVVIAAVGFLQGVFVGLMAAVILFGVNYGRTDVIRHELSGVHIHSRVTRPPQQRMQLKESLDQIHVWQLQGFIFFGTADALLNRIRGRISNLALSRLRFVVLDFYRVTGLDSTAVFSFQKLQQLADKQKVTVVYTGLLEHFQQQLQATFTEDNLVRWFSNLDEGLEWCEESLLADSSLPAPDKVPLRLKEQLQQLFLDEPLVEALMTYLTRHEVLAGDTLMKQGSLSDSLIFVESGQVTAQLERPSQPPLRLETMGNGRVVGELSFYLDQARTASVVADSASVVYELTRRELAKMEVEAPEAAARLHHLVAHLLAERATHLVATVDALQR